ncbi:hypothetical protein CBR_g67200, partial [Chara braunii]
MSNLRSDAPQPVMAGQTEGGVARVPGEEKGIGTRLRDQAASMAERFDPVNMIKEHGCSWAHYCHDIRRVIETHHFIAKLNEDFMQCLVYDSDKKDAKLIGIEYVVSEKLFSNLPDEEKKLWHSHYYE